MSVRPRPLPPYPSLLSVLVALVGAACAAGPAHRKSALSPPPSYGGAAPGYAAAETVTALPAPAASAGRRFDLAVLTGDDAEGDLGGGGGDKEAVTPPPPTTPDGTPREMLVVEGWVRLTVDSVRDATTRIVGETEAAGGKVVVENLTGAPEPHAGELRVRLPPDRVGAFLDFLNTLGTFEARRLQATDVSREYFDREITLRNLRLTLARLEALAAAEGVTTTDRIAIEREVTRLRGQIEQLEGQQRFLADRVSLATLDIQLARRKGPVASPRERFRPGARLTALWLVDAAPPREQLRLGGGAVLAFRREFTLDLDVLAADGEDAVFLVSAGSAAYSDFLGGGRRRFLNPYLGLRLGYAYLDGSAFLLGAEAGIELVKHPYLGIDAALRVLGLLGEQTDAALQGTLGLTIPF